MSRIPRERAQRIVRIGRLRIGERIMKGEKEIPQSLDYFLATGKYAHLFHGEFGDKPNSIEITFLSDDDDVSCDERLEIRKGKDLYGYTHNDEFFLFDPKNNNYKPIVPKDREKFMAEVIERLAAQSVKARWDEVLTMNFIILRLRKVFGFWTLTTKGSETSIPNIVSTYDMVKRMTGGRVRGIPFDLRVEKVKSTKPESKSVFPVLTLVPNMSQQSLQILAEYGRELDGLLSEEEVLKLEYDDAGEEPDQGGTPD